MLVLRMRAIIDEGRGSKAMSENPRKYVRDRLTPEVKIEGNEFTSIDGPVSDGASLSRSDGLHKSADRKECHSAMKAKLEKLALSYLDAIANAGLAETILDILEVFNKIQD